MSQGALALIAPDVALDYAANPPLKTLRAYDVVVVDPDQPGTDPSQYTQDYSQLFAYVSLGELGPGRTYGHDMPASWLGQVNPVWGGRRIDQTAPGWPEFVVQHIMAPLWQKGYRGFFLDTLDAYQNPSLTPAEREAQRQGLIRVIRAIHEQWPQAKLIFNRGFDLLPDVHDAVWMVAAESLYQTWNAQQKSYQTVSTSDTSWLKHQLKTIQERWHLPILVIDYLPPQQQALIDQTVKLILADGFMPFISTPALDSIGRGRIQVIPRQVLVIYDADDPPKPGFSINSLESQRLLGMPLAYIGLVPHYLSMQEAEHLDKLPDGLAGIIIWIDGENRGNHDWVVWTQRQIKSGVRMVFFHHLGYASDAADLSLLGLHLAESQDNDHWTLKQHDARAAFELPLPEQTTGLTALTSQEPSFQPWVLYQSETGTQSVPVAITSWGGYALDPWVDFSRSDELGGDRWYVQPADFIQQALRLDPSAPIPDLTTETGRRLFFVHIDGDGFVSKAERPDFPLAGQVLLDDVLKKRPVPTTMSVIEGELSPQGLYPNLSAQAEEAARQAFALPWVEIASHTWSHPFHWVLLQEGADHESGEDYHLPIPGYTFSLPREIDGSINYINSRLATPNKRVKVLLWSGACRAPAEAIAQTQEAGVLNMNGGDTTMTQFHHSWTYVSGPGVYKGDYYQVYAPNQNENVYTHEWTGPFYGFIKVIETYQLTETPVRLKPVDLYYHLYNVTKTASLNALNRIYDWTEHQPLHPIFASEYIKKVLDFNDAVLAKTPDGWRLRDLGDLRNWRLPATGPAIDLSQSRGLSGWNTGPQARYINTTGDNAELILSTHPQPVSYLQSANARVMGFHREGSTLTLDLQGEVPLQWDLWEVGNCSLVDQGHLLKSFAVHDHLYSYRTNDHVARSLRLNCRP
ncbi:MAG: hypothetical protein HKM02_00365 [Pseudomonadales bacterium]|nr:hypothetical protein [Pseudomonadales bacterium]